MFDNFGGKQPTGNVSTINSRKLTMYMKKNGRKETFIGADKIIQKLQKFIQKTENRKRKQKTIIYMKKNDVIRF